MKVLRTIFRLYKNYRPLSFFGGLSLLLLVISAFMFIPVLIEFIEVGLVPKIPTLIVSGFAAVVAAISFFAGLILETIVEKDRQMFEFRLQEIRMWEKNLKGR